MLRCSSRLRQVWSESVRLGRAVACPGDELRTQQILVAALDQQTVYEAESRRLDAQPHLTGRRLRDRRLNVLVGVERAIVSPSKHRISSSIATVTQACP